jgi:hypothetical protein
MSSDSPGLARLCGVAGGCAEDASEAEEQAPIPLRLADAETVVVVPTDVPFVDAELLHASAESCEGAKGGGPHIWSGPAKRSRVQSRALPPA